MIMSYPALVKFKPCTLSLTDTFSFYELSKPQLEAFAPPKFSDGGWTASHVPLLAALCAGCFDRS
jgi:hypothetical protein